MLPYRRSRSCIDLPGRRTSPRTPPSIVSGLRGSPLRKACCRPVALPRRFPRRRSAKCGVPLGRQKYSRPCATGRRGPRQEKGPRMPSITAHTLCSETACSSKQVHHPMASAIAEGSTLGDFLTDTLNGQAQTLLQTITPLLLRTRSRRNAQP